MYKFTEELLNYLISLIIFKKMKNEKFLHSYNLWEVFNVVSILKFNNLETTRFLCQLYIQDDSIDHIFS